MRLSARFDRFRARSRSIASCLTLSLIGILWTCNPRAGRADSFAGSPVTIAASDGQETGFKGSALKMVDFILALQNTDGAIPDSPGGGLVNVDSTMEYALMGLAAGFETTRDSQYLQGLERGIRWLAAREDMSSTAWRGSWYYAYSANPPYRHRPVSPGPGIRDVRGVDATSTLFVYLLHLHRQLSGSRRLADEYEGHARAALDFVLTRNRSQDGFFFSSWQQRREGGAWTLWRFQYTADQVDVYLGLSAGARLFDDPRYREAAAFLRTRTHRVFWDSDRKRYALGRDADGSLEPSLEGFNGIFPQGYLPWAWGERTENRSSLAWLQSRVRPDGSVVTGPGAPAYSLSAAILGMAATALSATPPARTFRWLTTVPFDPEDGGVRDTSDPKSPEYANVAAFSAVSLLGFAPF